MKFLVHNIKVITLWTVAVFYDTKSSVTLNLVSLTFKNLNFRAKHWLIMVNDRLAKFEVSRQNSTIKDFYRFDFSRQNCSSYNLVHRYFEFSRQSFYLATSKCVRTNLLIGRAIQSWTFLALTFHFHTFWIASARGASTESKWRDVRVPSGARRMQDLIAF